jgi:hypothetical protein
MKMLLRIIKKIIMFTQPSWFDEKDGYSKTDSMKKMDIQKNLDNFWAPIVRKT